MTQTQLAAISPETRPRTLRYRCARLARHGLAGRTRPYRERGSAPNHLWPTRKGDALISGQAPPRGGERREPNPLFLAHAAGLSEIYVALATTLPAEARLSAFKREGEAREPFITRLTREERAIAPDALVEIADADGKSLCAFVELDMGTMSSRQLKRKAAGYAAYAEARAWRERHRFCPALLFITTTERRARLFLAAMERDLGRDSLLLTCGCDLARRLDRCASEPGWLLADEEDAEKVDLLAALREARRPYDEALAEREAQQREDDAERERLRSNPEALRAHLRRWSHRDWGIERLGRLPAAALTITLEGEEPLADAEGDALGALAGFFADPLRLQLAEGEPTPREQRAFEELVEHHRDRQLDQIDELAREHGEGPALRRAAWRLDAGELLDQGELDALAREAVDEERSGAEQGRLREDYLLWREGEAQRLAKAQGLAARLRNGPETFLAEVDRRALRRCRGCEELAYPDPERARYEQRGARYNVAGRCHFCGSTSLSEIEPSSEEVDRF